MTYIQVFAFAALLRQCRFFIDAKGRLPWAVEHLRERLLADVAQPVFWEYEVVAAIQVAVILHHAGMTATLRHGAYTRRYACIVGQCGVKQLYEIRAYILPSSNISQRNRPHCPGVTEKGASDSASSSASDARCRPSSWPLIRSTTGVNWI